MCYVKLFHGEITIKESILIYTLLTASILMATAGTIWSFLPNDL
jgi:hypothetical protein